MEVTEEPCPMCDNGALTVLDETHDLRWCMSCGYWDKNADLRLAADFSVEIGERP